MFMGNFLQDNEHLTIEGYTFVGNIRKRKHHRAKRGSRDVDVLMKNNIYEKFDICDIYTEMLMVTYG